MGLFTDILREWRQNEVKRAPSTISCLLAWQLEGKQCWKKRDKNAEGKAIVSVPSQQFFPAQKLASTIGFLLSSFAMWIWNSAPRAKTLFHVSSICRLLQSLQFYIFLLSLSILVKFLSLFPNSLSLFLFKILYSSMMSSFFRFAVHIRHHT